MLNRARSAAESCGNGGLAKSIAISALVYRAQFGLEPETILRKLEKARRTLDPQNSYGQSNLLLEIANQLILRGQLEAASKALSEASTLIYGSQHRRYAHLLAFRFAEICYRRGDFAAALHSVQMHCAQLDKDHDRVNLLMALGMEIKLLKILKMDAQAALPSRTLNELTQMSHRALSKKIGARQFDRKLPASGEDQIELIFSSLSRENALSTVLRSPYHGLAYEALGLLPGTSWLVFESNEILVLSKGEVVSLSVKVPQQLRRLAEALASGLKSKESLIQEVWGYSYHPLQHDSLLYQAIARLREILGPLGHIVEVSDKGYRLRHDFGFIGATAVAGVAAPQQKPKDERPLKGLNARQIHILELFKDHQFLTVSDCQKRFEVSDMTLKRDFSSLVQGGWVQRIGQARSTCYSLLKT